MIEPADVRTMTLNTEEAQLVDAALRVLHTHLALDNRGSAAAAQRAASVGKLLQRLEARE